MIEHVSDAHLCHRLKLLLHLDWDRPGPRTVTIQLADEDGVLAFAVLVAGPELELVDARVSVR